jgi:hypothetical protein
VYEPITVEVDRAYGEGNYRSYSINFIGRQIRIVKAGHTKSLSENFLMNLEQRRISPRMGLPK